MKWVVLGTDKFGEALCQGLVDAEQDVSLFVTLVPELLPDGYGITEKPEGSKFFLRCRDINAPHTIKVIKKHAPDYLLVSWPKILSDEVLAIPKKYAIGTHPTELPANKGRHPLHWTVALGLRTCVLTFFKMDSRVDHGDILQQVYIDAEGLTIAELEEKAAKRARIYAKNIATNLERSHIEPMPQHGIGNYWRARIPEDCTIDPRMSADAIKRLVDSYSKPYPCAKLLIGGKRYPIEECHILDSANNFEYGKVLDMDGDYMSMQAGDGRSVWIRSTTDFPGVKYIYPPEKERGVVYPEIASIAGQNDMTNAEVVESFKCGMTPAGPTINGSHEETSAT